MKKEYEKCLDSFVGGIMGTTMMVVGLITMIVGFAWAAGGHIDDLHIGDYIRKED